MKLPILWRIEKFLNRKEEEKEDKYNTPLTARHKRTLGLCKKCGCTKFILRKNSRKCTRCSEKQYF